MPLTLTGFLICRTLDEADRVSALVPAHVETTRQERGCLSYEVWRSMADPVCFAVRAVYRDRDALAEHQVRAAGTNWGLATRGATRDFRLTENEG
jgi:quinol monooxygenase YgiN